MLLRDDLDEIVLRPHRISVRFGEMIPNGREDVLAWSIRILVAVDARHSRLCRQQAVGASRRRALRMEILVAAPLDERQGEDAGAPSTDGSDERAARDG